MEGPVDDARTAPAVSLLELAIVFARISTTAFGGAIIPMIRREVVVRDWMTTEEFLELYGLAQVCPGGIPITLATLIGRRICGPAGFFVALLAQTVPGFLALMALYLLSIDPHMGILRAALRGAAAAALGVMLTNAIELSWPYRTKAADLAILVTTIAAVMVLHLPLWIVLPGLLPISFAVLRAVRAL